MTDKVVYIASMRPRLNAAENLYDLGSISALPELQ